MTSTGPVITCLIPTTQFQSQCCLQRCPSYTRARVFGSCCVLVSGKNVNCFGARMLFEKRHFPACFANFLIFKSTSLIAKSVKLFLPESVHPMGTYRATDIVLGIVHRPFLMWALNIIGFHVNFLIWTFFEQHSTHVHLSPLWWKQHPLKTLVFLNLEPNHEIVKSPQAFSTYVLLQGMLSLDEL